MSAGSDASTPGEGPGRRALPPAAVAALAAAVLAGCGGGPATRPPAGGQAHGARATAAALEALLPGRLGGLRLHKASATGAGVLGDDAFSRSLSSFLRSRHLRSSDLRFANARTASGSLELGVFEAAGVDGRRLLDTIVAATRPNAPSLQVAAATLAGRPVTRLVYPGGAVLYLEASGARVFYVGTQSERLATRAFGALP
ncbi:MAG TPA: hypothetical protein VFB42_09540 [Gaiellaceae bacterium]|nr:hypothetical protein [Gaiellaceae bacterium]